MVDVFVERIIFGCESSAAHWLGETDESSPSFVCVHPP